VDVGAARARVKAKERMVKILVRPIAILSLINQSNQRSVIKFAKA
jgi:hypothetical protein